MSSASELCILHSALSEIVSLVSSGFKVVFVANWKVMR